MVKVFFTILIVKIWNINFWLLYVNPVSALMIQVHFDLLKIFF